MPAKILDGRKISAEIREELKVETARLKERGIIPGLAGVLVGSHEYHDLSPEVGEPPDAVELVLQIKRRRRRAKGENSSGRREEGDGGYDGEDSAALILPTTHPRDSAA